MSVKVRAVAIARAAAEQGDVAGARPALDALGDQLEARVQQAYRDGIGPVGAFDLLADTVAFVLARNIVDAVEGGAELLRAVFVEQLHSLMLGADAIASAIRPDRPGK